MINKTSVSKISILYIHKCSVIIIIIMKRICQRLQERYCESSKSKITNNLNYKRSSIIAIYNYVKIKIVKILKITLNVQAWNEEYSFVQRGLCHRCLHCFHP